MTMSYQSINPYNGKLLKTFKELTNPQLEKAVKTAAAAFEVWRQKSFAGRAAVVARAAEIMHARVDEFAKPVTLEMGNHHPWFICGEPAGHGGNAGFCGAGQGEGGY